MNMKRSALIVALLSAVTATGFVAGCASDKPMPAQRAGSYVDDSYLTTAVKTKLLGDTGLKSFDIHVETSNQVVVLSGAVPTDALRDQAGTVAKSVDGVKDVVNNIEVKP
jgi:hyperosmotically inducible protein